MSKDRLAPCQFYICKGECKKGRNAEQNGICQTCQKYRGRKGYKDIGKVKRNKERYKYYE